MKKNRKKLITLSVIACIVLIFVISNAIFTIVGNIEQKGEDKGYEWNQEQEFDINKYNNINIDDQKDFVILNLTDIHLRNHGTACAFLGVNYILDGYSELKITKLIKDANPDLITITGDTTLTKWNDIEYKKFIKYMDSFQIPWATIFGNHDGEGRADLKKLANILSESEYGLFQYGPSNIHGIGNYIINLKRNNEYIYSLFMMDSGSNIDVDGVMQYDGIHKDQINWYKWAVDGINNVVQTTVPNMCFVHIPLPEYKDIEEYEQGERREASCCMYHNYGFFDEFKNNNGTHVIVGHDHVNNFISDYQGVKLCYALKSSYNCYFGKDMVGGTILTIDKDNNVSITMKYF